MEVCPSSLQVAQQKWESSEELCHKAEIESSVLSVAVELLAERRARAQVGQPPPALRKENKEPNKG